MEQVACVTILRQLITTKTFALQAKTVTIDSKKIPIYCYGHQSYLTVFRNENTKQANCLIKHYYCIYII